MNFLKVFTFRIVVSFFQSRSFVYVVLSFEQNSFAIKRATKGKNEERAGSGIPTLKLSPVTVKMLPTAKLVLPTVFLKQLSRLSFCSG